MAKRWQASKAFTDVHYYGEANQGCLEKIKGVWVWRWYGNWDMDCSFGRDLKTAKKCAAALIELEG